MACGILVPGPQIELTSPELQGGSPATGPSWLLVLTSYLCVDDFLLLCLLLLESFPIFKIFFLES